MDNFLFTNIYPQLVIVCKLLIATLIGYVIGIQRKRQNKPGGSRTFGMVSLGSCIIAIISLELLQMPRHENVILNFSRLMSYGIASVGFIGSGLIIHNKSRVEGLTSASILYALVPICFCIGLGYYFIGILSSLIAYTVLDIKYILTDDD